MARKKNKRTRAEIEEGDEEEFVSLPLSGDTKRTIAAILLILFALIFFLGFFDAAGIVGESLTTFVAKIFGWGSMLAPLVLVVIALILLKKKPTVLYVTRIIGVLIVFVSILTLMQIVQTTGVTLDNYAKESGAIARAGHGGGLIGHGISHALISLTGRIAAVLIAVAVGIIGAIVAFNWSFVGVGDRVSDARTRIKKPAMNKAFSLFKKDREESYETSSEDETWDEEPFEEEEADTADTDELGTDFDDDDLAGEAYEDESEDDWDEEYEDEVAEDDAEEPQETLAQEATAVFSAIDWEHPDVSFLKKSSGSAKGGDTKTQAQLIQDTFQHFGIEMTLEDIVTGPTVTQYSFHPPTGVKLSKITALSQDLALALAAHPIRIEAPIPGKSLVGIEVPNKSTVAVRMRDILNSEAFTASTSPMTLALGEDVNGDYVVADLAKMPHLLVAGATGAGKSVAINSILVSLLYQNSPQDLKMILVDPKRVELSLYNGIPHLLADVIVDNGKVLNALKWALGEMDRRYKILQDTGSRNINSYNEKRLAGEMRTVTNEETGGSAKEELENLPAIVIVVDELADLMATHGKEVEGAVVRLAQMARAVGIHLIVSTQRPSVEVITGTIKANLPTRIALRVATGVDSRTILDTQGAEKLVGHGDMLFVGPSTPTPKRLQGVFIEEGEVKRVVSYLKKHAAEVGAMDIEEDFDSGTAGVGTAAGISAVDFDTAGTTSVLGGGGIGGEADDALFDEAKELVIASGKASTSYLQRRLRVGYSRAARLIDLLEEQGIVGPAEGSKPRTVLVEQPLDEAEDQNMAA